MHRLLVCFGNTEHGRLGLGVTALSSLTVPRVCMALAKYDLDSVAAGGAHTAVVTRGGLLFTFGLNSRGQLGHSPGAASVEDPGNVLLPEPVTAVAAGDAHTLCLTESGRVYAFGCNTAGQLGVGRETSVSERGTARPTLVEALTGARVVAVAAGGSHSLAVTEQGRVFAWGTGGSGRLGLGRGPGAPAAEGSSRAGSAGGADCGRSDPWVEWLPRCIDGAGLQGVRVAKVFAGPATSACTDDAGRVYSWGLGGLHQLGHGGGGEDEWEPRMIDVPSMRLTRRVALGAAHALACRDDERVHVWGSDRVGSGCMGLGRAPGPGPGLLVPRPTLFKFWFTDVAAGFAHSAGTSSDGRLYTWGWGGMVAGPGALPLPRLAELTAGDSREEGRGETVAAAAAGGGTDGSPGASALLRSGGGQLGVGAGVDLPAPTLVTKLEILPGEVFRQDNGDPFNYQDSNLGWLFRRVACGHNHTAAIIQVARSWTQALKSSSRESRAPLLPGGRGG